MSIRVLLYAIGSLLAVMLAYVSGERAWQSMAQYRSATRSETDNATADLLLRAAGEWAVERGRTNTALNTADIAAPAEIAAIALRRRDGDAALNAALTRLGGDAEQAMNATRRDADALRRRVDLALALPLAARDPALPPAWVGGITALIARSQALRLAHAAPPADTAARLAELQQIKHLAWVMSEYAGRERATLGGLIARGAPIPTATLRQLAAGRGRVDAAWELIAAYADRPDAPAAARAAAAGVTEAFLDRFEHVREAVYAAGLGDGRYPIDGSAWIAAATQGIDAILALNTALGATAADLAAASAGDGSRDCVVDLGFMAFGIAVTAISAVVVARRVIAPLRRLATVVARLADGDLDAEVDGAGRRDEIGGLASAVLILKANSMEKRRLEAAQAEAKRRADDERRESVSKMADVVETEIRAAMNAVAGETSAMARDADGMAESAARVTETAESVATATQGSLMNAAAVSAASEQLSASIREIAARMSSAGVVAEHGVVTGRRAGDRIRALADAASRITSVVDVISGIAAQTNLLALNATIEAARAGEAGRGFAVVASEVKTLAGQTAHSARDIVRQVAEIQESTRDAISVVEEVGGTIGEMATLSMAVAAAVEQQAAATAEIARNVAAVSDGSREVSSRIALVARDAEGTGRQAHHVRESSATIARAIEELQNGIVRIVRTSTSDTDRRAEPRFPARLACTLLLPGAATIAGRLVDLSRHGACVAPGDPLQALPAVGSRGALRIGAAAVAIPFRVRGVTPANEIRMGLDLEGTSAATDEVDRIVAELARTGAAEAA